MLIQQSKMAAMGEMINAISHQWKQPLNSLGLIVQCVEDEFEYGEVDKKYVKDFVKQTMELILFMSQTIDAFRNLLKPSRIKYTFDVTEAVYELVNLFSDMLKKMIFVYGLILHKHVVYLQ